MALQLSRVRVIWRRRPTGSCCVTLWRNENNDQSHSDALPQIRLLSTSTNERSSLQSKASRLREKASELRVTAQEKATKLRERAAEFAEKRREENAKKPKTLRAMLKAYGPVFVGAYFSLYVVTLGSLYAGISSGHIDPMTLLSYVKGSEAISESTTTASFVKDLLEKWSLTKPYAPMVEKYPQAANLGVAWIVTKVTEPLRIVAVSAAVPHIAPYFSFLNLNEPAEGEIEEQKDQQQQQAHSKEEEERSS